MLNNFETKIALKIACITSCYVILCSVYWSKNNYSCTKIVICFHKNCNFFSGIKNCWFNSWIVSLLYESISFHSRYISSISHSVQGLKYPGLYIKHNTHISLQKKNNRGGHEICNNLKKTYLQFKIQSFKSQYQRWYWFCEHP